MNPDMLIFWGVVVARFGIPLFIPRYPLPAIIAALLLDGVDQTIFQTFTNLPLDGYQSYDKALDIYYLVVAYISTLRNWTNQFAYKMARFLIFYRLIGVVLFEFSQIRALLLIFPNTFEYFFIFYEAVAVRWNPVRLSRRFVVGATAFIWIVIKLPQEYWIHIAQMDATEFLNEHLFGEPAEASIVQSFLTHPEITIPILLVLGLLIAMAWYVITRKLPAADWEMSFDTKKHVENEMIVSKSAYTKEALDVSREEFIEKAALLSLVAIIFGMILPGATITELQLAMGVILITGLNTGISHWFNLKGRDWGTMKRQFALMAVINGVLGWMYVEFLPRHSGGVNLENLLFYTLLLSLLITLYDRYRPVYEARFLKT